MGYFEVTNAALRGLDTRKYAFGILNPTDTFLALYDDGWVTSGILYGNRSANELDVGYTPLDFTTLRIDWITAYNNGFTSFIVQGAPFNASAAELDSGRWVKFSLSGHDTIIGNNYVDYVRGRNGNDALYGYGGNDTILGDAGSDDLFGGRGNDSLTGGNGKDWFFFNTRPGASNRDAIRDFIVADDTIALDNAVYTRAGPNGRLAPSAFIINEAGVALDASDRIIYDQNSGVLYYDPDGSGTQASTAFATIATNLALTYRDFYVV